MQKYIPGGLLCREWHPLELQVILDHSHFINLGVLLHEMVWPLLSHLQTMLPKEPAVAVCSAGCATSLAERSKQSLEWAVCDYNTCCCCPSTWWPELQNCIWKKFKSFQKRQIIIHFNDFLLHYSFSSQ